MSESQNLECVLCRTPVKSCYDADFSDDKHATAYYRAYDIRCEGDAYCEDCYTNEYFTCHDCGVEFEMQEACDIPEDEGSTIMIVDENEFICTSCLDRRKEG